MAGGQRGGRETGLVRRLRRTVQFLVLSSSLAFLASAALAAAISPAGSAGPVTATTPTTLPAATAPSPKLAKPSAYHAVEPATRVEKPMPKPVAAPLRRSSLPADQARQNHTPPARSPQRNIQPDTRLVAAPLPAPQYPGPAHPVWTTAAPTHLQPQPAPLRSDRQERARIPETYAPSGQYQNPEPRPYSQPPYSRLAYAQPTLAAYPQATPPPFARRILYQGNNYSGNQNQRRENGQNATEHLPAWMRKHQNESPAERERSLRLEPGFNRLPPAQQQNLINTLHHLNELPPEQRERTLMRMENMERLSPQMRDAVRSSARQLNDMPPDRRRMWQKAFRDLENLPPEQRQEILRSQEFAGQFSAQERSIMGNLLAVEPYRNPGPMEPPLLYGK